MTDNKKMFLVNILRIKGFEAFKKETESMGSSEIIEVLKSFLELGHNHSDIKDKKDSVNIRTKIYMTLSKREYEAERKI